MIRRARAEDAASIAAVHQAAFSDPAAAVDGLSPAAEPAEVALAERLIQAEDALPHLSWVAEQDGVVVGHVVASRGQVAGADIAAVGIGPLGVRPDAQRRGLGSALMHAVIAAADATGEDVLCLLGEVAYYERFGFRPATSLGLQPPDPSWGDLFQARVLRGAPPQGPFRYHAAFDPLLAEGAEAEVTNPQRLRRDEPRLRPARMEDAHALTALDVAGFDPATTPSETPPTDQTPFFERVGPEGHIVAVDTDDQAIGYVRLARQTSLASSDHVLAIQGLAVHPAHRGAGLGAALMQAAMERGRAEGKRKISLRVLGGNVRAQRLYRRLGFTIEGRLRDEFIVNGQPVDDVIMSRPL